MKYLIKFGYKIEIKLNAIVKLQSTAYIIQGDTKKRELLKTQQN